jgi:hypothetical protein
MGTVPVSTLVFAAVAVESSPILWDGFWLIKQHSIEIIIFLEKKDGSDAAEEEEVR